MAPCWHLAEKTWPGNKSEAYHTSHYGFPSPCRSSPQYTGGDAFLWSPPVIGAGIVRKWYWDGHLTGAYWCPSGTGKDHRLLDSCVWQGCHADLIGWQVSFWGFHERVNYGKFVFWLFWVWNNSRTGNNCLQQVEGKLQCKVDGRSERPIEVSFMWVKRNMNINHRRQFIRELKRTWMKKHNAV